jgi:hypothetical protein
MPWYIWLPFAIFGLASLACFASSYRHLRPDMQRRAHRLTLRGALIPQGLFPDRGSQLRALGWIWASCAMAVLVVWGLVQS